MWGCGAGWHPWGEISPLGIGDQSMLTQLALSLHALSL